MGAVELSFQFPLSIWLCSENKYIEITLNKIGLLETAFHPLNSLNSNLGIIGSSKVTSNDICPFVFLKCDVLRKHVVSFHIEQRSRIWRSSSFEAPEALS